MSSYDQDEVPNKWEDFGFVSCILLYIFFVIYVLFREHWSSGVDFFGPKVRTGTQSAVYYCTGLGALACIWRDYL